MANFHGDREPPFPEFVDPQDCFDEALEEILGPDNPTAYSVFTAMERIVRQFKLDTEAHGLLFDAYLRGKKALQQGKTIHNPKAWLKGTAFNLAREKYRKRQKICTYAPDLMDALFADEGDSPMDYAILDEELRAVVRAVCHLQIEHPDVFQLIHQKVVEGLSWREIQERYVQESGRDDISEAALRQRFSRGRRYLRKIFHEVMTAQ
ncbi:MAG: RNA polymerase sigma factor [Cyanobacteria bacterium P01_H01_bin.162]